MGSACSGSVFVLVQAPVLAPTQSFDPGAAGRTVPPVLADQPPPIPPSAGPVLLSTLFDFHLRTLNQVKKMSQTILNLLVGRQKAGGPIRIG